MTETASNVIVDALQQILVQASEASIEADEAQTAIRFMNRMMARLDADGIGLGYTVVSNLSDVITIPAAAMDGLIYNLAVALAPQYDAQVTPALAMMAKEGLETMRLITINIGPSSYGDTLPIGSGNEGDCWNVSHFYPDDQSTILSETTGSIGLEENTAENT